MPKQSPTTNSQDGIPAVSVRNLTVRYGKEKILDRISFDILQGSVTAIIGPNGSGKTTAVRAILDLVPKAEGEVRVMGRHFHAVRSLVGYVPQRFEFDRDFPMTVGEYMELARRMRCGRHITAETVASKLDRVGLPPRIVRMRLGELSGGQLQRLLIAQAVLNDPAVLFMDEPSTGIDIAGEASLYDIIEHLNFAHGTTVVMVTHDIAAISRKVDTVICINRKMLCYGPPQSALTEKKMSELFGEKTSLYEHHQH